MAEEFTIKSEQIEEKINQLLPSQGGFGAGVDFSASTMVIPIVDLTETAEGSQLRQDLQTAFSYNSATSHRFNTPNTHILQNTTGYWRVIGVFLTSNATASLNSFFIRTSSGAEKIIWESAPLSAGTLTFGYINVDLTFFLEAGDSLRFFNQTGTTFCGSSRQIADLQGNLINP